MNFRKLLIVPALAIGALSLTACNETVPAGHLGKIMGKTGFQPEVYPPSKVWLDESFPKGFNTTSEQLFLVETTTKKYNQPIKVLLKDKLTLNAEVVFRGRIRSENPQIVNTIFNDMKMNDTVVTTDEVYEVYGKMIVLNTARAIISQYNVDEVNQNYDRITKELYLAIKPKLESLPIEISDVTIGNIQYPDVVTKAIEVATERQMAIEKEEAEVQIKLTEAKGREELAKAEYRIKMQEAKRIRDYNEITSQGITKDLIKLRELELREKELDKWNGQLPTTLMSSGDSPVPVIVNTK
jgi:regulator of protease activity HflC (stomatin/prohibitin superfamily)